MAIVNRIDGLTRQPVVIKEGMNAVAQSQLRHPVPKDDGGGGDEEEVTTLDAARILRDGYIAMTNGQSFTSYDNLIVMIFAVQEKQPSIYMDSLQKEGDKWVNAAGTMTLKDSGYADLIWNSQSITSFSGSSIDGEDYTFMLFKGTQG